MGRVEGRQVRAFAVGSQTEGCVADDALGRFYIGEEAVGIWRYGAEPGAGDMRTLVDSADQRGHLTSNVEGLALAHGADGSGYLVASSQGSSTYALYRRGDNVKAASRSAMATGSTPSPTPTASTRPPPALGQPSRRAVRRAGWQERRRQPELQAGAVAGDC
jgi:myo-inositol-hexaphosphate 3-phosphohydrolase